MVFCLRTEGSNGSIFRNGWFQWFSQGYKFRGDALFCLWRKSRPRYWRLMTQTSKLVRQLWINKELPSQNLDPFLFIGVVPPNFMKSRTHLLKLSLNVRNSTKQMVTGQLSLSHIVFLEIKHSWTSTTPCRRYSVLFLLDCVKSRCPWFSNRVSTPII